MIHSSSSLSRPHPLAHTYVVKIQAQCDQTSEGIRGRIENVGSGRKQEFADGQALLMCIRSEEALALQEAIAQAQQEREQVGAGQDPARLPGL
jgi:hypothetical protein